MFFFVLLQVFWRENNRFTAEIDGHCQAVEVHSMLYYWDATVILHWPAAVTVATGRTERDTFCRFCNITETDFALKKSFTILIGQFVYQNIQSKCIYWNGGNNRLKALPQQTVSVPSPFFKTLWKHKINKKRLLPTIKNLPSLLIVSGQVTHVTAEASSICAMSEANYQGMQRRLKFACTFSSRWTSGCDLFDMQIVLTLVPTVIDKTQFNMQLSENIPQDNTRLNCTHIR